MSDFEVVGLSDSIHDADGYDYRVRKPYRLPRCPACGKRIVNGEMVIERDALRDGERIQTIHHAHCWPTFPAGEPLEFRDGLPIHPNVPEYEREAKRLHDRVLGLAPDKTATPEA